MIQLDSRALASVHGGADEPNPIQFGAGVAGIGTGVAILGQAGGGTAVLTGANAIPGVGAAAIAGAGGYMVGDYLEKKTGAGTALYNFIWWVDGYVDSAQRFLANPF